jgi:DNA-binding transcriptional LysR family regulator
MLELRRLRLLSELHRRGTIAAVADALQFTPSAVSQQLALLEREAGTPLTERSGRGVILTDAGRVLVGHADAIIERAARAEADLAAAAGLVAGRARIAAFQSVAIQLALPAIARLERDHPRLRCELVEAEPEDALPALERGDVDLVLGDEWRHQPLKLPRGVVRHALADDPVSLVLAPGHEATELSQLADAAWVTGHPGMAWELMTRRTCRELGGFEPDIRHRANDAVLALALVRAGLAVALLPRLALSPGVRTIELDTSRAVFAAVRAADAERPSTRALLAAVS